MEWDTRRGRPVASGRLRHDLPRPGRRDDHGQGLRHDGDPGPAVGRGIHEGPPRRDDPGDGRGLRHGGRRPGQRNHDARQLQPAHQGGGEGGGEAQQDRRRGVPDGDGRAGGGGERLQPGGAPDDQAGGDDLLRLHQQLEAGGRSGQEDHPLLPRVQQRDLRLLQGARPDEPGLRGGCPDHARDQRRGRGGLEGPQRHRLRRGGLLRHQPEAEDPQDQEGGEGRGHLPHGRGRQAQL